MKKMNRLEYACYAFQCDPEKTFVKEGFLYLPFDDCFPDDWAFDEFEVTQEFLDDVMFWVVKI